MENSDIALTIIQRKIFKITLGTNNLKVTNNGDFKRNINDNEEEALRIVQQCTSQETTKNLLKICVESRNNEFICKVLDVLKEKKFLQVNDDENNEQEEA